LGKVHKKAPYKSNVYEGERKMRVGKVLDINLNDLWIRLLFSKCNIFNDILRSTLQAYNIDTYCDNDDGLMFEALDLWEKVTKTGGSGEGKA